MKRNLNSMLLIVTLLLFSMRINAQNSKYQVAFLYNFTNYIEWPESYRTGNFIIGVLGQNSPLIKDLNELARMKQVHGQTIKVEVYTSVEDVSGCHILFVEKSFTGKISAVLKKLNNSSTLLVTDTPGSIANGAAISFIESNGKLGYEIQATNAEKYGLKLNSRLETLALNK